MKIILYFNEIYPAVILAGKLNEAQLVLFSLFQHKCKHSRHLNLIGSEAASGDELWFLYLINWLKTVVLEL